MTQSMTQSQSAVSVLLTVAEAVPWDTRARADADEIKTYDKPRLRRVQYRASLLPLSATRRLRLVRLGVGHRAAPIFGLLLFRRVPVPVSPDLPPPASRPAAATVRIVIDDAVVKHVLLFAEESVGHIDAVLRWTHEHRLRTPARNGRRTVRMFVNAPLLVGALAPSSQVSFLSIWSLSYGVVVSSDKRSIPVLCRCAYWDRRSRLSLYDVTMHLMFHAKPRMRGSVFFFRARSTAWTIHQNHSASLKRCAAYYSRTSPLQNGTNCTLYRSLGLSCW